MKVKYVVGVLASIVSIMLIEACTNDVQEIVEQVYPDKVISIEPTKAAELAKKIRAEVAVELAEGLKLELWASDSLVQDPVAISVDPKGGIYYTHTDRITNSEHDIRGYQDWMTISQSWESVEDRRKFLRETYDPSKSDENTSLTDLNGDGSHDWRDLTVEKERIWRIEDTDGDGIADRSRLYLEDFNEEITDLANGVEFFDDEVFIAVGPDLWRTKDTDGDGIVNTTESISHGYAVHIGFGAHGMSGVIMGPDGRLYWGIGDIGMNVVDQTGKRWKYPNQGVIVRSEVDGSNFEVFSMGHRNTHEFAFDKYGNLISEDNDGDHPGERERLVYVVEGSDSGWRSNWQYGKYTDPNNNKYNVWMDEKMSVPRWEGQAAYIVPPITNYVNGPTGFIYNPGTALSEEYADHFFVAEFRGTPARSPIHAFTLEPKGATFELGETKEIVKGTLPTGLDWGPDGALYYGDWIDGWGAKDYGRMWKLDVEGGENSAIRKEVKTLIQADFKTRSIDDLADLLGHKDMRIRQKAQFELAKRDGGLAALRSVAVSNNAQMARIHAIWGIGQYARKDKSIAKTFVGLLNDPDPEIVAQCLKLLGDVRYTDVGSKVIDLLGHDNDRVKFFAAEASGRMADKNAVQPLLEMLEQNNDEDAWLRHAGCYALFRIGEAEPLIALKDSPSRSLRIAAVVILRRLKNEGVAKFLNDEDEYIVAETARAINDDLSIPGVIPDLASLLNTTSSTNEVIIRRAINANLRAGTKVNINNLVSYINNPSAPGAMRAEAMAALATWANPSETDRVDGRYRGKITRDAEPANKALLPLIDGLIKDKDPDMQIAVSKAIERLDIKDAAESVLLQFKASSSADVRASMLKALSGIQSPDLDKALELGLADKSSTVRAMALELLPDSEIDDNVAITLFEKIMEIGSVKEKQSAINSLGRMTSEPAGDYLKKIFNKYVGSPNETSIQLDIIEAMEAYGSDSHKQMVVDHEEKINANDKYASFNIALEGGTRRKGRQVFYENKAAQCVRCHSIFEYGGDAGPSLTGIGDKMTKKEILESLLQPSKKIAAGYGMVSLELNDGESTAGFYIEEDDTTLSIKQGKEETIKINKSNIKSRTDVPSSMPSVEHIISKRQIRDLVEFLGGIKMES